jgi:hypothetical protein
MLTNGFRAFSRSQKQPPKTQMKLSAPTLQLVRTRMRLRCKKMHVQSQNEFVAPM